MKTTAWTIGMGMSGRPPTTQELLDFGFIDMALRLCPPGCLLVMDEEEL